jgi:hypothetical protein
MFRESLEELTRADQTNRMTAPASRDVPHPTTWMLTESGAKDLGWGRWKQFATDAEDACSESSEGPWVRVGWEVDAWEVLPHAAHYLPWALEVPDPEGFGTVLWHQVLLFFCAATGGEGLLNSLFPQGPGLVPFQERWRLRGEVPLPPVLWELLEQVLRWPTKGWSEDEDDKLGHPRAVAEGLVNEIEQIEKPGVSYRDFRWERVDVRLETGADEDSGLELPVSVHRLAPPCTQQPDIPPALRVREDQLAEQLRVRIGQIRARPRWAKFYEDFPGVSRADVQRAMRQISSVFVSDDHGAEKALERPAGLVVLPEVSLPHGEQGTVEDLVALTGRAALVGCSWRVLPTLMPGPRGTAVPRRFIVNEALLAVPLHKVGEEPSLVRAFFVRKPVPAHSETALARGLSEEPKRWGSTWKMLPGRRWYRFVHPEWGDFTVAICSDLLDSSPWSSLQGQLLHLFMCAYNKDVELYEALTWVRAYENYVNVVEANHGEHGGSFAWTPKHGHGKELARLRGGELLLIADIDLPVKDFFIQQKNGSRLAVDDELKGWKNQRAEKSAFKAPPPCYPGRR